MQKGDFAEIEYVGRIKESGDVFDLTDESLAKEKKIYNKNYKYGPITVVIGANQVLPGLDEQLQKSEPGTKATFEVSPEKAFGERNPELLKTFQMSEFRKQNVLPVVGQFITFQNGAKGKIISISSGRVKVDFNHPLAGKALEYDLKINRKVSSVDEQIDRVITFYVGSNIKIEKKIDSGKIQLIVPGEISLPAQLKKAIADDITKYVKDLVEVNFVEAFKKQEQKA